MELRIKDVCREKGITQKELAGLLGVSEMTLSRASKGNTSLDLLDRMAVALGVSVPELFAPQPTNTITCPHCGICGYCFKYLYLYTPNQQSHENNKFYRLAEQLKKVFGRSYKRFRHGYNKPGRRYGRRAYITGRI